MVKHGEFFLLIRTNNSKAGHLRAIIVAVPDICHESAISKNDVTTVICLDIHNITVPLSPDHRLEISTEVANIEEVRDPTIGRITQDPTTRSVTIQGGMVTYLKEVSRPAAKGLISTWWQLKE